MQSVHPQLLNELQNDRTIVELWEFFSSEEEDFSPENALLRFSNVGDTTGEGLSGLLIGGYEWDGQFYERRVISRGDIKRYLGKQANTVSVTLANADFELSRAALNYRFEGMWAQVRQPSLDNPNESLVLFAGRCQKPDVLFPELQLTISQDAGASDAALPSRKLTVICPLAADFKGVACRGNEPLSAKSAAYQAATECNGSREQCSAYGNLENNQGIPYVSISGTLTYQVTEVKRILGFIPVKKRRTESRPWSSTLEFQQDQVVPEVGGLTQVEGVPLLSADTGTRVRYLQVLAGEHTDDVANVIIRDKEYLPAPDTGTQQIAYGDFGSEGQPESLQFPGAGPLSGLTWVEGQAVGSDEASANDKAPTVTAILRGRQYEVPDDDGIFDESLIAWTDCGPYMVRHYLVNEGRLLRSQVDEESVIEAALTTFQPVIDDSGFEQAIIPNTITGGVDFRAYASAGGFGAETIDKILLLMAAGKRITGGYGQLVEAYYRYINQTNLPTFTVANRKIRRRYVSNFVLNEETTLGDFLHDILLPSFNGQLIYSAAGKVQIRVDQPALHTFLAAAAEAEDTEIAVEDVRAWDNRLGSLVIVGPHTAAAELARVQSFRYAELDDPIEVAVSDVGSLTISASAVELTGATDVNPARSTIALTGSVSEGAQVSVQVDGIAVSYTCQAGDDRDAVAGYLAATINGEATLRRYVWADWNGGSSFVLKLKTGWITLDRALTYDHARGEELLRIERAFGDTQTDDQSRFLADSFKWPLGARSSNYNRFVGKIRSITHDWAAVPIERNVIWHQKQVRRVNTLELNLSAVDTAHQAMRLLKIKSGKERYCDWYCSFGAGRDALLLDLGDVVAVSHYSMGGMQLIPVVIEDITIDRNQNAQIVARLYRSDIYDDRVSAIDSPILLPFAGGVKLAATADAATDKLTVPGHSLSVDDVIYLATGTGGALPGGLSANTAYYVLTVAGDDITVATTAGGSTVDLTDAGTSPFYVIVGLANNTDTTPSNTPTSPTGSNSGLGQRQEPPDYEQDGYGTGGSGGVVAI